MVHQNYAFINCHPTRSTIHNSNKTYMKLNKKEMKTKPGWHTTTYTLQRNISPFVIWTTITKEMALQRAVFSGSKTHHVKENEDKTWLKHTENQHCGLSIHSDDIFQVMWLDVFSTQLECLCHESRVWRPLLHHHLYLLWNFKLLQFAYEKKNVT